MYPRNLSRFINWARSHVSCGVEFEEEGDKVRVFLRTWDIDIFRRVCVAELDCYRSDPHQEETALGRVVDALGPDVSVASINGGSTVLVEAFCEYLGNGYRQKLIDYPVFDLRLFRRCLQRTASSVFGSLDGLAMDVGCWDAWLDVLSPCSKKGHPGQRLEYASSCWCCSQRHRRVALDCLLFEGDGAQRWWR